MCVEELNIPPRAIAEDVLNNIPEADDALIFMPMKQMLQTPVKRELLDQLGEGITSRYPRLLRENGKRVNDLLSTKINFTLCGYSEINDKNMTIANMLQTCLTGSHVAYCLLLILTVHANAIIDGCRHMFDSSPWTLVAHPTDLRQCLMDPSTSCRFCTSKKCTFYLAPDLLLAATNVKKQD